MEQIFTHLTHAVNGTPLIALSAALIWGILSLLLSPCHLASIPLIIGFIDDQGRTSTMRAFLSSLLFSAGILLTIAIIGVITAAAGRMIGDIGQYGNYIVALVFFIVGLHLLGVIPSPWSSPEKIGIKRKGFFAAFLLGLIFGIALGPCTFAYMAPILSITFKLSAEQPIYASSLLIIYGIGHCLVIIIAGTATELVQKYLHWNETSKGSLILKRICGILIILGGLYMLYIA
ncbi:MAG: cytochrome C biogenesis protein [Kiritimatiellae bacterium]|nr:cytochrome C biogenesis protein [Kiritimatiellia bacterium]